MARRTAPPTGDEIEQAIEAALKGKGSALARLVKACPEKDLARAFGHIGESYGTSFYGLGSVLAYCAGMKQSRQELAGWVREARRKKREEEKRDNTT